jgi:DNA-binding beta-propeller fold protein YncE
VVLLGLILAALTLVAAGGSSAATPQRTLAYVALEGDSQVAIADVGRGRVLARIAVPAGAHNLAATFDGRIVVVTSPPSGRITIIDGRRFRVLRTITGFRSPHDVKLAPDGRTAYVTDEARATLDVVDTGSGRLLRRLPAGAGAHDLAGGDLGWVTHGPRVVPLELFDLGRRPRNPTGMGTLDPRGPAHDIVRAPDTADVFVTYWESGVVARIRTGNARVLWRRTVGTETHHLAFDAFSGRRLWVTDRAGRLLLLAAANGAVLRRFGGCAGPHHVAVATGRRAVVACNTPGTVAVFDDRAGLVRTIAVGRGPHGIAVARVP